MSVVVSLLSIPEVRKGEGAPQPQGEELIQIVNLVQNPRLEHASATDPTQPEGFVRGHIGIAANVKLTWERKGLGGTRCVAAEVMDSSPVAYWETIVPVMPEAQYYISLRYKCQNQEPAKVVTGERQYNRGRPGGPNLELGAIFDNISKTLHPTSWSDIGIALGALGGTYLPLATDWVSYRQLVTTLKNQRKMQLKLRVLCYAQKVWFDDVSVVAAASLPPLTLLSPTREQVIPVGRKVILRWRPLRAPVNYLVECSPSPLFCESETSRWRVRGNQVTLTRKLLPGFWYWRVGVEDTSGIPCWLAEDRFWVGSPVWERWDTTPPVITRPTPAPTLEAEANTTIAAHLADAGTGIAIPSVRISLDGKEVTAQAKVTTEAVLLKPKAPIPRGIHKVEVTATDRAGNLGNPLRWSFGVGTSAPMKVEWDEHSLMVNGERYFPVGLYAYVCTPSDGRFRESLLAEAAAAGFDCLFNTIIAPDAREGIEKLNILSRYGVRTLLNITADMQKCETPESARHALLEKGQAQFRQHPAVLGYWADDPENLDSAEETPTPSATLRKLTNARQVLLQSGPRLPIIYAVSNLPRLPDCLPTADVIVAYRYPVPQYHPKMIYDWTLDYVKSVAHHKLVWFNSQGFDLGYGARFQSTEFRPTPSEMRAMAYYSLMHGISGYSLYATSLSPATQPEHWRCAMDIATQFRYLAPFLLQGQRGREASLQQDCTNASIYFREIQHKDTHLLIAVNMSGGRIGCRWRWARPVQAVALFENRRMSKTSAEMFDEFDPFGVHVYRW